MDIRHIIIQAGGLGIRLGKMTKNKPKGMVAIRNRPMMFHTFEQYPHAQFIVIGDYKYSILDGYMRTFAKVKYELVHATGSGNAAGIKMALKYIPEGAPFMLLWSDLLLSEDLNFNGLSNGNYIGLTTKFPCSWSMEDGQLYKNANGNPGVAGLFIFNDKSVLDTVPDEGSMTVWLKESGLLLKPFDILDSLEVGTLDAVRAIDSGVNRCRPYNSLDFGDEEVKKTALTDDGQKLLENEVTWYRKMQEYGFPFVPQIYSYNPLTMSRFHGKNIFDAQLKEEEKSKIVDNLIAALNLMHSYGMRSADTESLHEEYYAKTLRRLDSIKEAIPFSTEEYIIVNGRTCRNVLFFRQAFLKLIEKRLFCTEFFPIHGDCTLTNTMIDQSHNIYFIDARGYFGKNEVFGDIYYDWAKLYYSISGNFDQFNIKNFDLEIGEGDVRYEIKSNGWEGVTDHFFTLIGDCDIARIELIHAIIWLSLASHCWEDFDSLCTAFYVGINLLEDCW